MTLTASEAESGDLGLAICSLTMPDAVLIDNDIPDIDSCEFVKRLLRLPGGDRAKVVICASENDPPSLARAIYAGADDFVLKPLVGDLLRSKFAASSSLNEAAIR